jgi:hypothetical protein
LKRTDLHIHTWSSDGTWSPAVLLERLKSKRIEIFSITDHDTVESSEAFKILITDENHIFIPGVEVSTTFKGREYHLTAYHYDNQNKEFIDLIRWNDEVRLQYNYEFIDLQSKVYDTVSLDDYFNHYEEDPTKGGWKALNYFLDKGIYKTMYDYFEALAETKLQLTFRSPEEVIQILKNSGAFVFLAHPSYYYHNSVMPDFELKQWKNMGVDGLECYTPYAVKDDQTAYYKCFCTMNNLMVSGGSDSHGDFLDRPLGYPEIDISDLKIGPLLGVMDKGKTSAVIADSRRKL